MAQRLDPNCAMYHWGEALVLGPHINAAMEADAVAPAVAAVNKAQALMKRATPREQASIRALATRYSIDPQADRDALDAAYADAGRERASMPEPLMRKQEQLSKEASEEPEARS